MMSNRAPSQRRQDWRAILYSWLAVFVTTYTIALPLSWDLMTGSRWLGIVEHIRLILDSVWGLLAYQSLYSWQSYISFLHRIKIADAVLLHLLLPASACIALATYVASRYYIPGGIEGIKQTQGAKLFFYTSAIKHARKKLRKELEGSCTGIKIHPDIDLPKSREVGNFFVIGSQGAGKTVVITTLIEQVIQRGEHAFIYDEKREYTALFYKSDTTVLIAPWDRRSAKWDIQKDAHTTAKAQLIAEQLIAETRDPLWSNGARMIFVGMIEALNQTTDTWGWTELANVLSVEEDELKTLLDSHYPRAAKFIAENSKTTMSFLAQLIGSLGWIYTLADAWPNSYQNGFSVSKWLNEDKQRKPVIIVQADKRYKEIGAPLASALISLLSPEVLSQSNSYERETWLFLDELGNLPKTEALFDWMSLGRSKGCRLIAGTQSISQLKQIYTEHGASTLLSMFNNLIGMRVGSAGETANYAAKAFGERVVERPSYQSDARGRAKTSWQRETIPVITAAELVHLPYAKKERVEGFLLLPGLNSVFRLRWPFAKLLEIASEHEPADWLSIPPKPAQVEAMTRRDRIKQKRQQR